MSSVDTVIDERNTQRYRNKLLYGVIKTQNAKKVVYELEEYLPPITDFLYDPKTDTWVRTTELDSLNYVIPNTKIITNIDMWKNYNETPEDILLRDTVKRRRVDGFIIDEDDDYSRILDVKPLNGDTTEYISAVYNSDILGMILSYCVTGKCEYIRLRCVSHRFKNIIDTSTQLIQNIEDMIVCEELEMNGCPFAYPLNVIRAMLRSENGIPFCEIHNIVACGDKLIPYLEIEMMNVIQDNTERKHL